jgi:hypothetical protein
MTRQPLPARTRHSSVAVVPYSVGFEDALVEEVVPDRRARLRFEIGPCLAPGVHDLGDEPVGAAGVVFACRRSRRGPTSSASGRRRASSETPSRSAAPGRPGPSTAPAAWSTRLCASRAIERIQPRRLLF